MKRKLSAMVLSFTLVFSLLIVAPAAAATLEEQYTLELSVDEVEVVTEKLRFEDWDGLVTEGEYEVNILPIGTELTYSNTVLLYALYEVYAESETNDDTMIFFPGTWKVDGGEAMVNGIDVGSVGTIVFDEPGYYSLTIYNEPEDEERDVYFFKIEDEDDSDTDSDSAGSDNDSEGADDDAPDTWAATEVEKAINAGLVPTELQSQYKDIITRAEFSSLIIEVVKASLDLSLYEVLESKGLSLDENPFTDTDLEAVIAANKLGIVNGKGEGRFDPNGSITRQEAAVMLAKTAVAIGVDIDADDAGFSDDDDIAEWAGDSVDFVFSKGIMNGVNEGVFKPTGTYTRQQAYLTVLRLLDAIED